MCDSDWFICLIAEFSCPKIENVLVKENIWNISSMHSEVSAGLQLSFHMVGTPSTGFLYDSSTVKGEARRDDNTN